MAGMFGLFDYTKPGKGVKKTNASDKTAFFTYFEILGRKFFDLVKLNLIFMLFCIPIATVGPALAARSYILREFVKGKPVFLWSDFKDCFLSNFRQSLPVGLLHLFVSVLLGFNIYYIMFHMELGEAVTNIMVAVTAVAFIFFSFVHYYIYTLLITFDLSYAQLYRNSMIFAFQGFLHNVLAGVLKLVFVAAMALMLYASFAYNPLFFFFFFLIAVTVSFSLDGYTEMFITYPVIKKYLQTEIESEEDEEAIFTDEV